MTGSTITAAIVPGVLRLDDRLRSPCRDDPLRGQRTWCAIRKRIEEAFGWIKKIAEREKTSFRGRDRVAWAFTFAATACNLVRLPKLIAEAG